MEGYVGVGLDIFEVVEVKGSKGGSQDEDVLAARGAHLSDLLLALDNVLEAIA